MQVEQKSGSAGCDIGQTLNCEVLHKKQARLDPAREHDGGNFNAKLLGIGTGGSERFIQNGQSEILLLVRRDPARVDENYVFNMQGAAGREPLPAEGATVIEHRAEPDSHMQDLFDLRRLAVNGVANSMVELIYNLQIINDIMKTYIKCAEKAFMLTGDETVTGSSVDEVISAKKPTLPVLTDAEKR